MQNEYKIVIADTTCFILLYKIGEMDLLRSLFGAVTTTPVIAREFGLPLPEWVNIQSVTNQVFELSLDIDAGEASAIALALESESSLLVLDDGKARKTARRFGLNFTGTLGIFLKAKLDGVIPAVVPILQKVQKTNFRYPQTVFEEIIALAGENI